MKVRIVEWCLAELRTLESGGPSMAKGYRPKILLRSQLVGRLAQLVARVLSMHKVAGSIPAMSKL